MTDPSQQEPMTLADLEMLTNILLDETVKLGEEFQRKIRFIINEECLILQNEKDLIAVRLFINATKCCLFQTEFELQEQEQNLINLEKLASQLEQHDAGFPSVPTVISRNSNGYLAFLQLMLSADQTAARNMKLKDELDRYSKMNDGELNIKLTTMIMAYHLKALSIVEKQMDKLNREVNEVGMNFDGIKKRIEIKKRNVPKTFHFK